MLASSPQTSCKLIVVLSDPGSAHTAPEVSLSPIVSPRRYTYVLTLGDGDFVYDFARGCCDRS